jgi:uncharacterized protein involved in exopolysaccharide biosynthesis
MTNPTEKENIKRFEDFFITLIKYRKIIIINSLIVAIVTAALSLFLPNKYTSTASFISPKKKGGLFGDIGGFSNTIKDLSRTLGGRIGTVSDEAYNYLVILQSKNASQRIIEKYNLRKVYKIDETKPFEEVFNELENNVDFNIEDEGNVVVSVIDEDPVRAADMANYYIQILNEISTELSTTESRYNREFIEKRLIQAQTDIKNLEDSLENFSKKYNVIALEEQMKAAINVAAEVKANMEIAKLERDILKKNYNSDNPLVQQAEIKVNEFEKQLGNLKFGEDKNLKNSLNIFVPFENVSETGIQYIRLTRDYEIQNKLVQFIFPIYEQSRIEENKDIPVVLVVDKAVPPQKKTSPKRSFIVLGATLLSFFFSIVFALFKESFSSIKLDTNRYQKIKDGIIEPIKSSFRFK